jgi:phage shock protein E
MNKILAAVGLITLVGLGAFGTLRAEEGGQAPKPAPKEGTPQLIDVAGAEKLIAAKKVVILDVRTAQEFAAGHLEGATNLDFHDKNFEKKLEELSKDQAYLVHCAVGGRSARASAMMSRLKFKSIYDLKGGITAWEKAGKPVVKR